VLRSRHVHIKIRQNLSDYCTNVVAGVSLSSYLPRNGRYLAQDVYPAAGVSRSRHFLGMVADVPQPSVALETV